MARSRTKAGTRAANAAHPPVKLPDDPGSGPVFPIVGIGASAGGLEAFTQLLEALPTDTGMGFVLVQHLDPDHASALVQILARATSLPVCEIAHDQRVLADHVYVIPRDHSLRISDGVLKLAKRPRTRSPHRPIDAFFESLALDQRERAIGVVLSGTATDGTLGLEGIKAEGGITFAQDDSAKHDSMPRSAIAAGCVDLVLSPAAIAAELARIAKHPYAIGQLPGLATGGEDDRPEATPRRRQARAEAAASPARVAVGYRKIVLLLHEHSGVDFTLYKSSTIQRRIARRVVLNRLNTLDEYAVLLQGNTKELAALYSDVLISVTSFFRNPETFEVLQHRVLPELVERRGDDPVRCWVLGCSTGQEAYSIAMLFIEAAEKASRIKKLQVFATDLNDTLLDKARHGLYARPLVDGITPQRLRRFFVEEDGGYRIIKPLRDMVVFARQNLIADPPFSRMDLISCRNLLIYLEPSLQQKAIPTFHYALKPKGFLMLGGSESIGGFTDLFDPVDKKHKIYSRKPGLTAKVPLPISGRRSPSADPHPHPHLPLGLPDARDAPDDSRGELDAQREADRLTVQQFGPPAVLVNAELAILQFRGPTSAFLQPPVGKASFDVLKMARDGLMLPLRRVINQAKKENKTARKENVRVQRNGETRMVNLEVIPLKNLPERCFLILFEDVDPAGRRRPRDPEPAQARPATERGKDQRIAEVEAELRETHEYLQTLREQHEGASEELQASNEEVQSANEELQSVNEELETSKEELESANEELITVNEEMFNRNAELNRLNNDLINLQNSTQLATVLLGRDLTVRRFTPQAEKQLNLRTSDLGQPIGHVRHDLVPAEAQAPLDLEALAAEVIASVREQELEVRDRLGRYHWLRIRPYITVDNKVDGAILVLVDISAVKHADEAVARYAAIVASTDDAVISTDLAGTIQTWNQGAQRLFGYTADEALGKPATLLTPTERSNEEPGSLERVARGEAIDHSETVRQRKDGSLVAISLTVSPIRDGAGRIVGAAKIARDITERKQIAAELERYSTELAQADLRKNEFLAMLGHELRNPLSALTLGLAQQGKVPADPVRVERLREMMVRQTRRMTTLLDQLLDIARITSGKIELTIARVDLAEVVRGAIETVRSLPESQHQELTMTVPSEPVLVTGDAVRLSQVVENLLTNAVKYTPEGGRIRVLISATDDLARITVSDTGVGISAEFLPHVFEVFAQAPRTLDRAKGGLGLGLPLARRLVEMHRGRIDATSHGIGQGSEFVVSLPRLLERPSRVTAAPAGAETAPAELGTLRPRRILVVDDEKDAADLLTELLENRGHTALAVGGGRAALAAVPTFDPEVVLLDLGLPEMDGYEVARRLRDARPAKKLLLIAVTGYENDPARLQQAGFDQHLIKPLDLEQLLASIAEWNEDARPLSRS